MRRELPDRTSITGQWEGTEKYPGRVTVAMSDGAVFKYRKEDGEHPAFLRAMEILRSWPETIGRHERRESA